jgi:hypothetical protein
MASESPACEKSGVVGLEIVCYGMPVNRGSPWTSTSVGKALKRAVWV